MIYARIIGRRPANYTGVLRARDLNYVQLYIVARAIKYRDWKSILNFGSVSRDAAEPVAIYALHYS